MNQLVRLAQLIGLNAVPGNGFFARNWSAGTLLALYWFENLLGSLLVALRIDLHRRLTHKRGHYVSRKASAVTMTFGDGDSVRNVNVGTILPSFLISATGFTVAEGIGVLARVFLIFLVVFIGVGAIAFFNAPRTVLIVFMGLKTFIDITGELPESQTGEAPQWQLAIASLFGKNAKAKFAAFSRQANREYGTYQPEDEEEVTG